MSHEPKFPVYPEKPIEAAIPTDAAVEKGALSVRELAELQRTLATFYEELEMRSANEDWIEKDGKSPEECLKEFLSDQWGVLGKGLRNKSTRDITLKLIIVAQGVLKQHRSEAGVRDLLNDLLTLNEAVFEEELNHERDDTQDLVLNAVAGLLSKEMHLHQESHFAEKFLVKHLERLQQSLFEDFKDFGGLDNWPAAKVWQKMFLGFNRGENLQRIWVTFKTLWEANPKKNWITLYQELFHGLQNDHYVEEIDTNRNFAMKSAIDLTGLDGSRVMKQWMLLGENAASNETFQHKNLATLYFLKQHLPEAPKELYERFGIVHFGRYTVDMLETQFRERDLQRPYGIVLFPYADHNGAFFQDAQSLMTLQRDLHIDANHSLRVIEVGSRSEVAGAVIRLDRDYGRGEEGHRISFAIIGGHGTPDSIQLGDAGLPGDKVFLKDIGGDRLTKGAQSYFEPGASVVLFSCSTGAKDGIAEKMKNQYGWNLKAPDQPGNVQDIQLRLDDGKIDFDVTYVSNREKISTMHYQPIKKSKLSDTDH